MILIENIKNSFPECPEELSNKIENLLQDISREWYNSGIRPQIDEKTLLHWDKLIEDWINDKTLPMLIRKRSQGRGKIYYHEETGRELIPTDNTPAKWIFAQAYIEGSEFNLDNIRAMFERKTIPIAMALSKKEKQETNYNNIKNYIDINKLGWKLCHIQPVGLRKRISFNQLPIKTLEEHFRNFLSPSNMFLVPKKMSGLGEIPHIIEYMKDNKR
ncbi:MAG: hypothetical protein ACFFD2_26135 [Promethearchaeota archaeon]